MTIVVHNHSALPPELGSSLAEVVRIQEEAGCTVLTDGFYSSRDPVWLAMECIEGVEAGLPVDYYGAGFMVPTPIVRDHLHYRRDAAVERWRAAQAESQYPVKAVLPGPLTLAQLADHRGSPYRDRGSLAEAWATALLPEFVALVQAGATWIQLDEPAVLHCPEAIRLLRDLLEPFWESREGARLLVSTWGAPASPMYAQLHSLPTDVVGVDLVSNPELVDLISDVGASQELYLGLAGPNGTVFDGTAFERKLRKLLHNYEFSQIHLGPTCGLGALAPPSAAQLLRELGGLGRDLSETTRPLLL